MPHISIKMYPGRDRNTKEKIAKIMCDTLVKEMNSEEKYFSVSIEEVSPENWKKIEESINPNDIFIKSNF